MLEHNHNVTLETIRGYELMGSPHSIHVGGRGGASSSTPIVTPIVTDILAGQKTRGNEAFHSKVPKKIPWRASRAR